MKAQKIRVFGKVQGVYFRVSAKQKADNLGLKGFVKNDPDGSVFIEVEGEEEAVDNMINWCRRGPALARVSDISIENTKLEKFKTFTIV